jgi:predicted small lipoprotein YifL
MKRTIVTLGLAAFVAGIAGCGKESPPPPPPAPKVEAPAASPAPSAVQAPVSVVNISLGKGIGADKKVTDATDSFAKNDTIYAAVETTGTGTATLKAKWTYHKGDKTAAVDESTQTISPTGPATSEFHISKPDGWPAGEYHLEVSLDDKPVGTKKFSVN